jgi:hypothetical protein
MQRLRGETLIGVGGLGLRSLACYYISDQAIESKRAAWKWLRLGIEGLDALAVALKHIEVLLGSSI